MTTKFIQPGNVLDYTAGTAVTAGQAFLIGKRLAVALVAIAAGATGEVAVTRVFSVIKKTTDVIAQGDLLYWDDTNKYLTSTSAGNTLAGYAAAAAGNGATSIAIKLNG